MATFVGGLKSVLDSANGLRADIHVNDMDIDGDIDIGGELCITDGVKDNVCLGINGILVDPAMDTSNTIQVFKADGITELMAVDTISDNVRFGNVTLAGQTITTSSGDLLVDAFADIKIDSKTLVGVTDTDAFAVEAKGSGLPIFRCDTTNPLVEVKGDDVNMFRVVDGLAATILNIDTVGPIVEVKGDNAAMFRVVDGLDAAILNVDTVGPIIEIKGDNTSMLRVVDTLGGVHFEVDTTGNRVTVQGNISAVAGNDLELKSAGGDNIVFNPQGGSVSVSEGEFIIDDTDNEAFLVRRNNDSGDIFIVDTKDQEVNVLGNGLTLPTSGATAALLEHYSVDTVGSTYTGAFTSASINHTFVRIGKIINMEINGFSGTVGAAPGFLTMTTAYPTIYRPSQTSYQTAIATVSGTLRVIIVFMRSDSKIEIHNTDASGDIADFPALAAIIIQNIYLSWHNA